jgi:hypothetical protein
VTATGDDVSKLPAVISSVCNALCVAVALCAVAAGPGTAVAQQPPSGKSVGCVEIARLSARNTPADILPGMRQCIDGGDYRRAARLYAVAHLYGRFDTLRVPDERAHQVIADLLHQYLGPLDKDTAAKFQSNVREMSASPEGLMALCTQVRALGPPAYAPTYMSPDAALKPGFDAQTAWRVMLNEDLHCSPAAASAH